MNPPLEIVQDRYGISYRFANRTELARARGPPPEDVSPEPENVSPEKAQLVDAVGPVLSHLTWEFTLVEAHFLLLTNWTYSVHMAHANGPGDRTLSFREHSSTCKYYQTLKQSNIQHAVLPWNPNPSDQVTTTLRITTGGDTEQYTDPGEPFHFVTPKAHTIRKVVPAGVTWRVSFRFVLDMEKPVNSRLYSRLVNYGTGISTPRDWLDAVQVQIWHGSEPKYLCVSYRMIDTNVDIRNLHYVKPLLYNLTSVELQGDNLEGEILTSLYHINLFRKGDEE